MTTVDLELAKELQSVCKEKGIKLLKSYFSYASRMPSQTTIIRCTWQTESPNWELVAYAYTLDELLEIAINNKICIYIGYDFDRKQYEAWVYDDRYEFIAADKYSHSNAACKLLIFLIKVLS